MRQEFESQEGSERTADVNFAVRSGDVRHASLRGHASPTLQLRTADSSGFTPEPKFRSLDPRRRRRSRPRSFDVFCSDEIDGSAFCPESECIIDSEDEGRRRVQFGFAE